MLPHYFEVFKMFVETQDKLSASFYLVIAKIFAGVTFLPGAPLTILAGAVFGLYWGTVISIVGNTIGATLAFLLSRYVLRNFVQNKILKNNTKINQYQDKLFEQGFKTVLFMRIVPLFPFNALNFLLGVTQVKLKDYFFATLFGMLPGTVAFVYFGESVKMLSAYNIVFSILGIAGLAYIGKIWKN